MYLCVRVAVMVRFDSESYDGYEGDEFVMATLVASGTASFPYTVTVIPVDSTPVSASNATDYDDTPVNVTFLPGTTRVNFRVPIIQDLIEEGMETFTLMVEVDVLGVFPGLPPFARVNIKEQTGMHVAMTELPPPCNA